MMIVQRLCEPIYGSRRNVTTYRWFTSISLAEFSLQPGLTTIGTMKATCLNLETIVLERPIDFNLSQ